MIPKLQAIYANIQANNGFVGSDVEGINKVKAGGYAYVFFPLTGLMLANAGMVQLTPDVLLTQFVAFATPLGVLR